MAQFWLVGIAVILALVLITGLVGLVCCMFSSDYDQREERRGRGQ